MLNNSIYHVNIFNNQDNILGFNEESVEQNDLPEVPEVKNRIELNTFSRKWSTYFSNMEDASLFSQNHEPPEDLNPPQSIF
jgi:hypothetical protein